MRENTCPGTWVGMTPVLSLLFLCVGANSREYYA